MIKSAKEKQHVISFSGGRTSAYLVFLAQKMRLNKNIKIDFIFMDTGAEHLETYKFIKRVVSEFKINLICLRAVTNFIVGKGNTYEVIPIDEIGKNLKPWEDMLKKYGTPYVSGGEFCTDRMKTTPYKKYCDDNYGKNNYITWLGIRADEPKRLKEKKHFKYLAEISEFDKSDIINWWGKQCFDLSIDEHLGNCVFCIKKSLNKIALATKDEKLEAIKFYNMLNSKETRIVKSRTSHHLMMYRGKNTLMQIINSYQDIPRNEIAIRARRSKQYNSGSCTESCEIFND